MRVLIYLGLALAFFVSFSLSIFEALQYRLRQAVGVGETRESLPGPVEEVKSHLKYGIIAPRKVSSGETFLVQVEPQAFDLGEGTIISINGVRGAPQYLQLAGRPASQHIVVTAFRKGKTIQKRREILIVPHETELPYPIIESTESRYSPRTVAFRVGNGNSSEFNGATFTWEFGDGSYGQTRGLDVFEHDYTNALLRENVTTQFNVSVSALFQDGSNTTAKRTVSVYNLYAYNKVRGMLTPRGRIHSIGVHTFRQSEPLSWWLVNVTNLEDETIEFGEQRIELLDSTPGHLNTIQAPQGINWTIGPRETGYVNVSLWNSTFTGNVFGFAVHFNGTSRDTRLPVITSVYQRVKMPFNLARTVDNGALVDALNAMFRGASVGARISHANLQHILATAAVPPPLPQLYGPNISFDALPDNKSAYEFTFRKDFSSMFKPLDMRVINYLIDGGSKSLENNQSSPSTTDSTQNSCDPPSSGGPDIVAGNECDPDNVPDEIPDGFACQYSGSDAWKFVPGMILNAHRGDLLLSPGGGGGFIGQLLQHVDPAQLYSHQGIMTKNFIEVRHCTESQEWLLGHPKGFKGMDGFEENALKYGWPGTITQSIDHSTYGEIMTAPDNNQPYMVEALSYYPNRGDHNVLTTPLVVKPPPQLETHAIRLKLHDVACAAQNINAHYRFYAYTKPEIALGPEGVAPPSAGWASGTVGAVCSSFIWLACQKLGIQLEGSNKYTSTSDLEPQDIELGAMVGPDTLDGLYLYTAQERQNVANWLHDFIAATAAQHVTGISGSIAGLLNVPNHIANLFVNVFAFDQADSDALYHNDISSITDANAVSPDNTLWWDDPGLNNAGGFHGIYGFQQDLFYCPGDYRMAHIYKWTYHPTKGSLCGSVFASGVPEQGCEVALTGQDDVLTGADGSFCFSNVPEGSYTVSAGMNINGYWNSITQVVNIQGGLTTNTVLMLQPPPEIHREVRVVVHMTVWQAGISACGDCDQEFDLPMQTAELSPFNDAATLVFEADYYKPYTNGRLFVGLHLNADLTVSVSWTAQLRDGADVKDSMSNVGTVNPGETYGWSGLEMSHSTLFSYRAVAMDWTVENALAPA
jgi:hypothetical protein